MNTYKLRFNNGAKFQTTCKTLDKAQAKVVSYINKNDLTSCSIICPNGIIKTVNKTGAWHWNHNGFTFN
jgi:hypothetical protein